MLSLFRATTLMCLLSFSAFSDPIAVVENATFTESGDDLFVTFDLVSRIRDGYDNLPICLKITLLEEDVIWDEELGVRVIQITQASATPNRINGWSQQMDLKFTNGAGGWYGDDYDLTVEQTPCPEPAAAGLLGTGGAAMLLLRARRRRLRAICAGSGSIAPGSLADDSLSTSQGPQV